MRRASPRSYGRCSSTKKRSRPNARGETDGGVRIAYGEPVARATGETDEPFRVLLDEGLSDGRRQRLAIFSALPAGACMRLGEDAAQVRVATARLDEQGDVMPVLQRHLGAGDRPDAKRLRGVGELERAVDAVVVGERERR